jgi:hypothetical protein
MLSGNLHSITSREYLGELIQIDGSDHRWFEDRERPARFWCSSMTPPAAPPILALISALFEEQMT